MTIPNLYELIHKKEYEGVNAEEKQIRYRLDTMIEKGFVDKQRDESGMQVFFLKTEE